MKRNLSLFGVIGRLSAFGGGYGLFHVGEILLAFAAVLTIWSGVVYLLAAWPVLRGAPKES